MEENERKGVEWKTRMRWMQESCR